MNVNRYRSTYERKQYHSHVFRAQVIGFSVALTTLGMNPNVSLATHGDHALVTFRAKPQSRTGAAQALRDLVAIKLRLDRYYDRVGRYTRCIDITKPI